MPVLKKVRFWGYFGWETPTASQAGIGILPKCAKDSEATVNGIKKTFGLIIFSEAIAAVER
jgi:hypothetical protein